MADIARLGFSADTSALDTTTAKLDALVPAAQRAQSGIEKFNATASGMGGNAKVAETAAGRLNAALQSVASGANVSNRALLSAGTGMVTVQQAAAGASAPLETLYLRLSQIEPAARKARGGLDNLGKTANDNISRLQATPGNIAAQFQDIGVTAAAGMSPLLIALQQGTQLSAAFAGGGLSQLGAAIKQILSPTTLLTIAFVALVAVVIQWAMAAFNAGDGATKLSEDLDKVKFSTSALHQAQQILGGVFAMTTGKMKDQTDAAIALAHAQLAVARVKSIATENEAQRTIATSMGETEWQIGGGLGGGFSIGRELTDSARQLRQIKSQFDHGVIGYDKAISQLETLQDRGVITAKVFGEVAAAYANIGVERANQPLLQQAEDQLNAKHLTAPFLTPKKNKGGKTDAQKFQDIIEGAQNDIASQKAAADAINLTAEAAATLEEKTKLLNAARTQEIKLTAPMIEQINKLAEAYGTAKVEADRLKISQELSNATDAELSNLKAQSDLIGLYGKNLAFAAEYAKEYAAAKAKFGNDKTGLMYFAATHISASAGAIADQTAANDNKRFVTDATQGYMQQTNALRAQREALGLSADQALKFSNEQKVLNEALQKHLELSDDDKNALIAQADAVTALEIAYNKMKDAMDFLRNTSRQFFQDWYDGIRQGKNIFSAFADAVVNGLNHIIDRLLDKNIENFLDNMFKQNTGQGGGLINGIIRAIGGMGGAPNPALAGSVSDAMAANPSLFAKGGTFTNSIVSSPTLFSFAKGTQLGQMGEAGPEGILPLKRGRDGSLGVQAHGGASGTVINAPITVNNDNRVTGAVSSADIVALQRRAAEQTKAEIKRAIPEILRQYQTDGAIAA